jgi:hypothetical protein
MDQRSGWGDHWYPDGDVIPQEQLPGNFGPDFVPRPLHIPKRGEWYCVELMVQANTVGVRDGRVAAWINGNLIADWQNVRFRTVATLKIDQFELVLGANSNTDGADTQWFDHVVVAKSYIGPMVPKDTPPPPPPAEPTLMELAALIAAVQTTLGNIETRLAALEARPTDPEIAARVAAVEAAIVGLKAFEADVRNP